MGAEFKADCSGGCNADSLASRTLRANRRSMTFRSLFRTCCAVAALTGVLPTAFSADSAAAGKVPASKSVAPEHDYVRYTGDNQRGRLETVVVTLQNAAGAKVDLIGAVHIADAAYYQALMHLFTGYEALLFELVDGQKLRESVGRRNSALHRTRRPVRHCRRAMLAGN